MPRKKVASEPKLLSGGNPQIAKGDGDGPVQAYIAAMPGWKHDVGRQIDDLVVATVPDICKAVRWNTVFYGIEDNGWAIGVHCFTHYVKLSFLNGGSLEPPPPEASKYPAVRSLHIPENEPIDTKLVQSWIKRSCELPGDPLF
jgi:hypothetical protein